MKRCVWTLMAVLIAATATSCAYAEVSMTGKKLIEYGWDVPNTQYVREHIDEMEKIAFDGVVVYVAPKPDFKGGNTETLPWQTFSAERFKPEDYEHAIADLKATKFHRFTDNFIGLIAMPGDIDWFDPAWPSISHNARCLAKVAKQGGCKGIMFDPEHYGKEPLWAYSKFSAAKQAAHTFDEYYAQVRLRGKEFIRTINKEYPDITILALYGSCLPVVQSEATGSLQTADYGLLIAFYDGMLDGASAKTNIVDGFELSYGYSKPDHFDKGRHIMLEKAKAMSKNPKKFAKHVSCGFGIWVDNESAEAGWHPDDFTKNYFSPEGFRNSLALALEKSDRYVWVYSERLNWWDMNVPKPYTDALALAKDGPTVEQAPK